MQYRARTRRKPSATVKDSWVDKKNNRAQSEICVGCRMDKFYTSLLEELRAFEEQVQKCHANFDLQTLQRVLTALSEGHKAELGSWQQIEQFLQSGNTSDKQWLQLRDYLSWLLSYVKYLRTMKESFDGHVVFPLCDNLYVNDEADNVSAPGLQVPLYSDNIANTARKLFHHRRRWALLLTVGSLGQTQLSSGESISPLLLHCIPDIFKESLVTLNLARQWILIHEARLKNILPTGHQGNHLRTSALTGRPYWEGNKTLAKGDSEITSQLKDTREQMMFLLWRVGRAEALELQMKETNQKVLSLQQDVNEVKQFILKQKQEKSEEQIQINPETQGKLETLKKQLKLERFHQGILNSDLLLELEVRPYLIRQIDTVKDRCNQLETILNTEKATTDESPQSSVLSDIEWESSSVFSQASTRGSDVFSSN